MEFLIETIQQLLQNDLLSLGMLAFGTIAPDNNARADDFINESEKDATPANDAGKVVKLESDGKFDGSFMRSPNVETFTSSGTWTKPAGLSYVIVEVQGSGGGGGGGDFDDSIALGGSGSAGGYSRELISASSLASSVSVTVGSGGSGGSNGSSPSAGSNGNTSQFGGYTEGYGGQGGAAGEVLVEEGGEGLLGDLNIRGGHSSGVRGESSFGGDSMLGKGGVSITSTGDSSTSSQGPTGYGSGGNGGVEHSSGFHISSKNGASGVVIVTEYYI